MIPKIIILINLIIIFQTNMCIYIYYHYYIILFKINVINHK